MTSSDTLSQLRAGKLAGIKRLDLSAGLTEFPREIFDLADSLEILNLSQNKLSALPDDLPRLRKLRILFCSENAFTHLPAVLGNCQSLSMVGFKSNQIRTVDEASLPPSLRWLILTDNQISRLPSSIGQCRGLHKLMLAGNLLEELPHELSACTNLELLRLSSNRLREFPHVLFALPRLSWLALAANPFSEMNVEPLPTAEIDWAHIALQEVLGEGASGIIYKAHWNHDSDSTTRSVAVKMFKGAVTSDGLPACEMANSIAAGSQLNLIPVIGKITNHPTDIPGLIMSLIDPAFVNLAGPPSLDSCTRDIYDADLRFSVSTTLRLALGIASAAAHLHERGILHGDLYGHNVLWNPEGECLLGDFGASSTYQTDVGAIASALQSIEVRAFGCLLEELITRCVAEDREGPVMESLESLRASCLTPELLARPLFSEIQMELQRLTTLRGDCV